MSYNLDLSDLPRASRTLTGELVRRIADTIEQGVLQPGDRLPTTRELATQADVNPMTAARVYRRLAELGYVEAAVGRGTFVRALPPFAFDDLDDEWQSVALPAPRPSARERQLHDAMRFVYSEDVISLAIGAPAPESIPATELAAAAAAAFAEHGPAVVGYGDVEGLPALREELGRLGAEAGFAGSPDELIVTSGARQGLDLVVRSILGPGDVACVESPGYVLMISSLEASGARLIGIPTDADGLDVAALERVLARHPVKLVALQPVCQNPTGRHLSAERRRRLLELARERSFFVLEDGVYSRSGFDGKVPQALRADAPSHVVYVDSFSKNLGGGLRLGWIAASGPAFNRLVALKLATDMHTSTLDQHIAARYLASGHFAGLRKRQASFYRGRADALLSALDRHFGDEIDLLDPLGGHNVWITFRRRIDERALVTEALRQGVSVSPGYAALVEESPRSCMRLSFSLLAEEHADEAVRRLAVALRAVLRAERFGATAATT